MTFPPIPASVEALGLDPKPLARLRELITAHIAEGRYPAAQIAVARHGKLGLVWTLGDARLDPQRVAACDETLWLLFSNTKVITACAVWLLVERGARARRVAAATRPRARWRRSIRCCCRAASSAARACSRRARSPTSRVTTRVIASMATWACRCIAGSGRICAGPPRPFAASDRW